MAEAIATRAGGARGRWTRRGATTVAVLGVLAIGAAVRAPQLTDPGYLPDREQFFAWALIAREASPAAVYDKFADGGATRRWCNYPPVHVLLFMAAAEATEGLSGEPFDERLAGDASRGVDRGAVRVTYAAFRLPTAVADLVTGGLLCCWLSRRISPGFGAAVALMYVVMPAVVHDSMAWGQVDAVHTLWMLLSVEAARRRRFGWMGVWAALGVLTKPQAVVLAPIWLAVLMAGCRRQPAACASRGVKAGLAAVATTVVIMIPFGWGGVPGVRDALVGAVDRYPYVHLNGFSAWFLASPLPRPGVDFSPYPRDDVAWVAGLSCRTLGLMLLAGTAAWAAWRVLRGGEEGELFRAVTLLALAAFVLPTQMHERYLYPAVGLWAWAAVPRWSWWVCWLVVSLAAALNATWVFAGATPGWIGKRVAEFVGDPSHGIGLGTACAAALIVVLLASVNRACTSPSSRTAGCGRP